MREGWIKKKLGDVCQVSAGQGAPQGEDNYSDVGIPFVKAGNLVELINGKQESDIQKVSDEVAKTHRLALYKAGSVVFAKSGMSCMKGHVYTLKNDCYVVSHLAILQPKSIGSTYLNYYLQHHKPNNLIKDEGYPSISLKDIENSTISMPSNIEQESRVVSELDKINELIRLKKEQLSDYDKLAMSIFYEMFGDPVENEHGWEVKKIGDVCSLKSGDSKANQSPKGTLPYVKVGDMNLPGNENYITYSSTYVDRTFNQKGIFPIGSILFPKRGGAILTNKKRMAAVEVCCDLNTMGVIPSEVLNKHYLFQWFKILDLGTICSGSTILQLNNCDIAPLLIQIPPLALQNLFAQRIELIEKQQAEIKSTIADLETLLASRMQYWFD